MSQTYKYEIAFEPDCGILPHPQNGNVTLPSQTVFNSTANYTCKPGYKIIGDVRRRCLASGVWGGLEPACFVLSKTALYANKVGIQNDILSIVYIIAYKLHICL